MTKAEFFKLRDEQRKAGLIVDCPAEVHQNFLTEEEEARILTALRTQKGGVYKTADLELTNLLTMVVYEGQRIEVQRKQIDQLDNITAWRK